MNLYIRKVRFHRGVSGNGWQWSATSHDASAATSGELCDVSADASRASTSDGFVRGRGFEWLYPTERTLTDVAFHSLRRRPPKIYSLLSLFTHTFASHIQLYQNGRRTSTSSL
jgi:hypothetical protein